MRRARRWTLGIAAVLGVLLLTVVSAVWIFTNTDAGRERVRRFALDALAGKVRGVVKVGRVSGNLLTGATIHGFAITDSAGNPFVAAEELRARYSLRGLLGKKLFFDDVLLVHPVVVLDQPPGGEWNWKRIFPDDTTASDPSAAPGYGAWIRLTDVTVREGRVLVRTPWSPADSLAGTARDSAIGDALGGGTRALVIRHPAGFQKVMDFRALSGQFPLMRLADPDTSVMRLVVARAQLVALPFRPPAAEVRDLAGTFDVTGDSLWFAGIRAALPASRLSGNGRYDIANGDLRLRLNAAPVAMNDLRWVYPLLPSSGSGTAEFALDFVGDSTRYATRNTDLVIERARARGDFGLALTDSTWAFFDTRLTVAGLDTRLIEQLAPTLSVPRRGVIGGRLAIDGGDRANSAPELTVDGDLTFDDARLGRNRMTALGAIGFGAGGPLRMRNLRVQLRPLQVELAKALAPASAADLPISGTLSGRATMDGTTTGALAIVADLTHVDRGATSRLAGDGTVQFAAAAPGATIGAVRSVSVDARLLPLALATVGRFAPAVGLRGAASGPVRVRGSLGDLAVDADLRLPENGAMLLRGRFDLASATPGYQLTAAMRLFNANAIVSTAPSTSLTARASADGRGFDPATMNARFTADVAASQFDKVPLDSARIRVAVAGGMLRVDSTSVTGPSIRADLAGQFGLAAGRSGTISYRVQVDSLSKFNALLPAPDTGIVAPRPARAAAILAQALADSVRQAERVAVEEAATGQASTRRTAKLTPVVPEAVRRDSLAGTLYAAGVITGGLPRFDLRGRAGVEKLVAYGNTVERGRMEYAWSGARTPASAFAVGAQLDTAVVGGFLLDSIDARATYRARAGTVAVVLKQGATQEYSVAADYALHLDHNEVHWRDLALRFDTTRWVSTQPGGVRWGARGIEVETLELRSGTTGRIYVDGLLPTAGAASLQVAVDNFQIGDIVSLLQSDVPASGLVSLGMNFEGTMADPRFRGAMGIVRGGYRGYALPAVQSTFRYQDRRLVAGALASRDGAELIAGPAGPVGVPFLDARGEIPVNLAFSGVTGPRLLDGPLVVDIRADSLPLDIIPAFTDVVSNVRGIARGTVEVRGTAKAPELAGQLTLERGQARVVDAGVTLRGITGSLSLKGDSIVIDSLVARSGGRILVRGGIGVKTLAEPSFDMFLVANGARVLDNRRGRMTLDAGLALKGPFAAPYVSGAITRVNGVLYLPESDGKTVISAGDPAVFNVVDTSVVAETELLPAQSAFLANLRADVDVQVSRDTWVRSKDANVEVFTDGPLSVRVDRKTQALALTGTLSSDRGEYTFLSKRFQIRRGSATFVGTPDLDPLLQATGEYEVRLPGQRAFSIRVLIGGTVSAPRLVLESDAEPPISQSDLLSYLAFGRSSSSLLQVGGSAVGGGGSSNGLATAGSFATQRLAAVALGVAVDQVETGAARSLGADVFNITPADVSTEVFQGTGAGSFLRGTEIEFGRYFNGSKLYVALRGRPTRALPGLTTQFRTGAGWRYEASLEPRYLIVDPSLGAQQAPGVTSVFGLFVIREWRF